MDGCTLEWAACCKPAVVAQEVHCWIKHCSHDLACVPAPLQAATPAPITPAGDPAAATAAAAAQQQEQEQLRQAAAREDELLAFDFAGSLGVLEGHEKAAQQSEEQAAPLADVAQEQLLVLDQASGRLSRDLGTCR